MKDVIFQDKKKRLALWTNILNPKMIVKKKLKFFFVRSMPHYGKNKYISTDVDLVEDIKSNKRNNNIKDLLSELQLLVKNGNLGIILKKEGELSLYIILSNKLMNPIELIIPQNDIKERKLLKQLYLTLLNNEQKHLHESKRINEKLINLENAVELNVNQSQHNRFSIKVIFEEDFDC